MQDNEQMEELLADSRVAFISRHSDMALDFAQRAIKLGQGNPEAYKCAADACMLLGRHEEAVSNYADALRHDPENGNRYYHLGFAQAMDGKLADAMKNLVKADELGCSDANAARLYNVLGALYFEIGRYKDALVNLEKAERAVGIDLDIMQRKEVIYGIQDDLENGLLMARQLKLIPPSAYCGYQFAFRMLVQGGHIDAAGQELEKSREYVAPTIDFYDDQIDLELIRYEGDKNTEHLESVFAILEKILGTQRPAVQKVIKCYIMAASIHMKLEKPDRAIDCLYAAQNPVGAYNRGFDMATKEPGFITLSAHNAEDVAKINKERLSKGYGGS